MRCRRRSAYDRLLPVVWLAAASVHDVQTHRLDNGLTLHVAPGHPAPVVAVSELADMFDGTESLVGIITTPVYVRETFLP